MPIPALESLADEAGKSLTDAERYWDEAKDSAKEKGFDENSDRFYKYVMGIVKRRLGLSNNEEISMKKLSSFLHKQAIQEMVFDHISKKINIRDNIYEANTNSYNAFVNEARELYKSGKIEIDADDKRFLETLAGKQGVYEGKKVNLDSPTRISGGDKKFRVYTDSGKKDKDGNIKAKKIEWGAAGMTIKNDNDEARKAFLKRHQCHLKKDKTTPGWWACHVHLFAKQLGLKSSKPW